MVKEVTGSAKWIPFAGPDEENYLGLDFDPGPKGTVGQVINFARISSSMERRGMCSPSFGGFLHFLSQQFANDQVELDGEFQILQSRRRSKEGLPCNLLTGLALFFDDE